VKAITRKKNGGRCVVCGSKSNLQCDHIIPWSKGGSSKDPKNFQPLCRRCNLEKSNKIAYRPNFWRRMYYAVRRGLLKFKDYLWQSIKDCFFIPLILIR
jgi:hypothetical protein